MSSNEELQIPLEDIKSATNNFSDENLIGSGGFGPVYRGESEKHGVIAIKRLTHDRRGHPQGDHEFRREIAAHSTYKHDNLASLLGYCDEDGERILVYKYESNGSLDKHLKNKNLSWTGRLQISLDAARGLMYLHNGVGLEDYILHRDVKSANILLDENWRAKISDFGLSRNVKLSESSFAISNPCGTIGYTDPDYLYAGHLTSKSDVFSFGVVLFELLCGRAAFSRVDRQYFYLWVQKHYNRQTLDMIIHPDLYKQMNPTSLHIYSTIAYRCLRNGEERPTMKEVVEQLQKALDHQLADSGPGTCSDVYDAYAYPRDGYVRFHPTVLGSYNENSLYDLFISAERKLSSSWSDEVLSAIKECNSNLMDHFRIASTQPWGQINTKAIERSKNAVVVLNKDYIDTPSNLEELAFIMKCRNERGQNVIPIFYGLDPSELRRQNGRCGAASSKHNSEEVETWRKALMDVANIPEYHVVTGNEEGAIKRIAYTIAQHHLSLFPSYEATARTRPHTEIPLIRVH